jgi:glutathione synthase
LTVRLGIVMDPIGAINIKKDSSFAMLLEACARQWQISYMELNDLYLRDGQTFARMRSLTVERNPQSWYRFGTESDEPLKNLDVVLMRKDPPFDQEYIYATYLLEVAEASGVLVINKPQSLRDANEKLYTAWFTECCAPTLVAREAVRFKEFLHEQGEIVLKPLDGMGGRSIFHIRQGDPNLNVILETMTCNGKRFIMAQRYLPEIRDGDKRILLVDGEPVPYALARIPAQGESRGNLAAGGRAEGRPLTARDFWLARQIGPVLKKKGLVFVGLDVIGEFVTEINVTSPTCIQELDAEFGLNISGQLLDCIGATLLSGER